MKGQMFIQFVGLDP